MKRSFVILALAGFCAAPAYSATQNLDFDITSNGGNVIWDGIDDEGASLDFNIRPTTGSQANAINDARTPNRGDAYDDALAYAVNGLLVDNADNDVEVNTTAEGTDVVFDPVVPAGLTAQQEFFFFEGDPVVRSYFSLTNTGSTTVSVEIENASDLGSDGDESVQADGTGDGVFDENDSYVVFNDTDNVDPDTLFTFFGDGASVTPSTAGLFDSDDVNALFEFDLAAGETKSILIFAGVFDPIIFTPLDITELAEELTGSLDDLAAGGFLFGLSDAQIATVVNYGSVSAVPLPLSLTLLLTGFGGLAAIRRKSSAKAMA